MTMTFGSICLAIAALTPAAALAATQSVTETAKYMLADSDSRNDARQICASTAKRTALDRAGSVFESDLTTQKAETTAGINDNARLQMRSYVAAVVASEVVAEQFIVQNDRLLITCTVRISFDPDEVRRKLLEIAGHGDLRQKLAAQQTQMDNLEQRVRTLSDSVKAAALDRPPQVAAAPTPPAAKEAAPSAPQRATPPWQQPQVVHPPATAYQPYATGYYYYYWPDYAYTYGHGYAGRYYAPRRWW
jgi:hypothetical protein